MTNLETLKRIELLINSLKYSSTYTKELKENVKIMIETEKLIKH